MDSFQILMNACNQGTDNCHVNAQCTDTAGGFQCDCMPGFEGSGITCTSIRLLQINAIMLAIVTNSQFHISQLNRHQ